MGRASRLQGAEEAGSTALGLVVPAFLPKHCRQFTTKADGLSPPTRESKGFSAKQ
jgi:hypothetical protein